MRESIVFLVGIGKLEAYYCIIIVYYIIITKNRQIKTKIFYSIPAANEASPS